MLAAAGAAFVIRSCLAVGIENMAILALGREPAISVQTALGLVLRQLVMAVFRSADNRGSAIALQGDRGRRVDLRERHIRSGRHPGQRSHRAACRR